MENKHTSKGLSNQKACFWVETDLEPDDVQALMVLSTKGRIDVVVAGGSTEPAKVAESAAQFMKLLKLREMPKIITGFADKHEFMHRCWEHTSRSSDIISSVGLVITARGYVDAFEAWVMRCIVRMETPVFVSIKPPHEMFSCFEKISADTMKKVDAICHMGFNSREVLNANSEMTQKYRAMLRRFNRVFIFTRSSIDGDCSVVESTGGGIFDVMTAPDHGPFLVAHNKLMSYWNMHIVTKLKEKIASKAETKKEDGGDSANPSELGSVIRVDSDMRECMSLIAKIDKSRGRQFLLADQCAVIAVFSEHIVEENMFRAAISFDSDNNPVIGSTCDISSNLYSFCDVDPKEMVSEMRSIFKRFVDEKI